MVLGRYLECMLVLRLTCARVSGALKRPVSFTFLMQTGCLRVFVDLHRLDWTFA